MERVYFIKNITSDNLVKIYEYLGKDLKGNVGVKVSTGEAGNPNHLNPNLIKELVHKLNGIIIECNTAYAGKRELTEEHLKVAEEHGFTKISKVDIMDANGDVELPVKNGKYLKVNYVGANLNDYDSLLILSHFKGHPMGGFGGALKNIAIGIASSRGKKHIHSGGKKRLNMWSTPQNVFLESMAEAVSSVMDKYKENMIYINVINNLTVDCDCVAKPKPVCMNDIGIAASLDPVALDQACVDMIYSTSDSGAIQLIERIEKQNGLHLIDYAEELGLGSKKYELVNID